MMAFSDHEKQYRRMKEIFGRANRRYEEALLEKRETVNEILFGLGKEALQENGDWTTLHHSRPIEVPKGG